MQRLRWLSLLALALLALIACERSAVTPSPAVQSTETPPATAASKSSAPTATPTPMPTPAPCTPAPTYKPRTMRYGDVEVTLYNDSEITMRVNSQDESKVDVCAQNVETGNVDLCVTIPDIHPKHHTESLYAIWTVGYTPEKWDSDEWTQELWKYGADGKGTKLYSGHSGQGLSFRVAPDERYIALFVSDATQSGDKLILLDSSGNPVREFTAEQLTARDKQAHAPLAAYLSLLKWSDDSKEFWGVASVGPSPQTLYKINTDSWQVTLYDISELAIPQEYDLNVNTAKLAYSDCPQIYAADDAEEFAKSQQRVSLFVYDLDRRNTQVIATAVAKCFRPRWLDDNTIEYNNPNGDDRITFTVR